MGNAVIFAGSTVKTLKSAIALKDDSHIASGSLDPSVSGFDAPLGSLYLRTTGALFVKTGALSTDWQPSVVGTGSSSFSDADFELYKDSDATAVAQFDLSDISAATTRSFQLPDSNGYVAVGTPASGEVVFWQAIGAPSPIVLFNQTSALGSIQGQVNSFFGNPFTAALSGDLVSVELSVFQSFGTPFADIFRVLIFPLSGGFPVSPAIATSNTFDMSSLAGGNHTATLTFSGPPVALTAASQYAMVIEITANPSPFFSGPFRHAFVTNAGFDSASGLTGSWALNNYQYQFTVNGAGAATPALPVLESEAALSPTRGGTGVQNNSASTLTLSGAFPLAFTLASSTSLTLPASGTLATLAGSESLTNKAISASNATLTWASIAAGTGAANGWLQYGRQSAVASTPSNAFRVFNNNDDNLSWIKPDGFVRTIASTVTANRTYTLPNEAGTFLLGDASSAGIGNGQTNANVTGLLLASSSYRAAFITYAVYRSTDTSEAAEHGVIRAVYKTQAASWEFDNTAAGTGGISFSITAGGQVQYTTNTLTGTGHAGNMYWKLEKLGV